MEAHPPVSPYNNKQPMEAHPPHTVSLHNESDYTVHFVLSEISLQNSDKTPVKPLPSSQEGSGPTKRKRKGHHNDGPKIKWHKSISPHHKAQHRHLYFHHRPLMHPTIR